MIKLFQSGKNEASREEFWIKLSQMMIHIERVVLISAIASITFTTLIQWTLQQMGVANLNFMVGIIIAAICGSIIPYALAKLLFIYHSIIMNQREIIEVEKEKNEKLLLSILPRPVAEDLKNNGYSEPETFENVSVLFSDFVRFTEISSSLEPSFLISELNTIFTKFDEIMEKHGSERIKTIGDAYLAVCGMPIANQNHAENVIKAAIEMVQYLQERNQSQELQWKLRIGIHSGNVVGGVVGVKKYIYDVFGDTINIASRMESFSEPMKINISEECYQLVKDQFTFVERKTFDVKGKGSMKMYFIEI